CLKYAFPDEQAGTIVVKLRRDGEIQLVVEDDGVGCGEDIREGSGSMLMQLLTRQLGGTMNRTNGPPGRRVQGRMPGWSGRRSRAGWRTTRAFSTGLA